MAAHLVTAMDELQQRRRPSAATDTGLLLLVLCDYTIAAPADSCSTVKAELSPTVAESVRLLVGS